MTKSISGQERRFFLVLLSIISFFLILFFIDYRWSATSLSQGKNIGYITYKNNIVQRKGTLDRIWSRLISKSPLYDKDIVRADRLSDAEVHLNDGTRIKIEENSMFRLEFSGEDAEISFDRGSIRIEQGDKSTQGLLVRAGGREVKLEQSKVKIESGGKEQKKGKSDKELNVSVEKGKAKILANKRSSSEYIVGAQEQAKISSQLQGGIVVRKLPVILRNPPDQKVYLVKGKQAKVKFDWRAIKKIRQLKLEVSYSRSFANKLHSLSLSGPREILFQPGVYYWRIRGIEASTRKKIKSLIYKFEVTTKEPLRIFSPENKKTFYYVRKLPLIRFLWSNLKQAQHYLFHIDSKAELKKNKGSLKLDVPNYSLNLDTGKYYWQVTAIDREGKILSKSPLYTLGIRKTNTYIPPKIQAPRAKQKIEQKNLSGGLLFSWEAIEELEQFDFQLSKNPSFRKLLSHKTTQDNFIKLRILLDTGSYYWRVRGKTKDKKQSRYSPAYSFSIFKTQKAEPEPKVVVDEDKPIPKEGWTPPKSNIPEGLRDASLEEYRKYINSLSTRCKKAGPPDLLIRKCFLTTIYLNLEGWHRLYLFYFLKMENRNFKNRYQAYDFFSENCNFRPARELTQFYRQNNERLRLAEKDKLSKLSLAFQNCK